MNSRGFDSRDIGPQRLSTGYSQGCCYRVAAVKFMYLAYDEEKNDNGRRQACTQGLSKP
jgi:hypothetical protein